MLRGTVYQVLPSVIAQRVMDLSFHFAAQGAFVVPIIYVAGDGPLNVTAEISVCVLLGVFES